MWLHVIMCCDLLWYVICMIQSYRVGTFGSLELGPEGPQRVGAGGPHWDTLTRGSTELQPRVAIMWLLWYFGELTKLMLTVFSVMCFRYQWWPWEGAGLIRTHIWDWMYLILGDICETKIWCYDILWMNGFVKMWFQMWKIVLIFTVLQVGIRA